MGDDAAKGLGARVERSRLALILCAVGLAALATASAVPIAFVAFFAPVIARRVVGPGHVAFVPSALMGSAVVLASDLIGRRILAPTELPVGISRRSSAPHTCSTCCGRRTGSDVAAERWSRRRDIVVRGRDPATWPAPKVAGHGI